MFILYKDNKPLLNCKYWEDLVSFVEKLKELNKKFVNRRDFVIKSYNEIWYTWNRK